MLIILLSQSLINMELFHQVAALVYGILSCFYMFFMMRSNRTHLKAFTKILPLIVAAVCVMYTVTRNIAPLDIKSPFYMPKMNMTLWELLFSMIGDIYLVYSRLFIYGLLSFCIAQCFLTFTLSDDGFLFFQVRTPELMSLLCISIISLAVFYLLPKLKCAMAIPGFIYCFLITIMFWSAVMQAQKHISIVSVSGAFGAGVFYISDLVLSINKYGKQIPMADVIIMITYYIAQLVIPLSVIYSE